LELATGSDIRSGVLPLQAEIMDRELEQFLVENKVTEKSRLPRILGLHHLVVDSSSSLPCLLSQPFSSENSSTSFTKWAL